MADEGAMQNSHVAKDIDDVDVVSTRSIFIKVLEVIVSIFAVGLIVDPFDSFHQIFSHPPARPKLDDIAVIYVSIAGFLVINAILIIGHLLGDRMPKRTSVLFSATGTILHIVAGSVIIHNWRKLHNNYAYVYNNNTYASKQYSDMLIAGSFFTYVNALVFAVDVFFTIKYF